ncbi:type I polyketide synthase [Paenibacillus alba]|uniref:Beta-ketoacyl synthase N-terminal-like domain-containing protein n=1 Tax=Paenibacillus alba TaxID=1197127 RepID=A0ABU6GAQ0_9BACL|nr:beta-ketoacyl synthase N-terminal-like domain-containing protein [Paenibacillus alba]MEC0231016.1 beta-ketoacyl synthase N-terminal-like domain-containing protein [Paenibacillus alba]
MKSSDVTNWLVKEIALLVGRNPEGLDIREPFSSYGLDSAKSMLLSGELSAALDIPVSPTIFWDYPSIQELSLYLCERGAKRNNEVAAASSIAPDQRESIAIVGMGCRFPGISGVGEFWEHLLRGTDAIREYPLDREKLGEVKVDRHGGYLDGIDGFDYPFFHISYREAIRMDPQQRLLLEVAWEALMDAGISPELWANTRSGVFIGISNSDYGRRELEAADGFHIHSVMGGALCIAANRLSYFLGLHGPSMAIDTACSSSLVAVHQACHSIWSGESQQAIAGGVNVILSNGVTSSLVKAGMLASDDRCKTFDAQADGYVRGEGCGVVILKPLSKALQDGDDVYAVIPGSALNQDGRSNGITAPNQSAQEKLLFSAYAQAGIQPSQIGYIEAHGTGTFLGDPIEVKALGQVLSNGRQADDPIYLGSVKSNIGHLESAAGIAGLIKTALIMRHEVVPPNLHFHTWNPEIPRAGFPFLVPIKCEALKPGDDVYGGVSSFGFGGTNAHIVLGKPPLVRNVDDTSEMEPFVFTLSAARKDGLSLLAQKYVDWLQKAEKCDLPAIGAALLRGRKHHEHRLAIAVSSKESLIAALQDYVGASESSPLWLYGYVGSQPTEAVFCFGDYDGENLEDTGEEVTINDAVFRHSYFVVKQLYRHLTDEPLQNESKFNVFAKQYAYAQMLRQWGITPQVCMGEGLGRLTADVMDGRLSLVQAIECLVRGEPMDVGQLEMGAGVNGITICLLSVPSRVTQCRSTVIVSECRDELAWLQLQCDLYAKGLFVPEGFARTRKLSHMLPTYPWHHQSCWKTTIANAGEPNDITCFC